MLDEKVMRFTFGPAVSLVSLVLASAACGGSPPAQEPKKVASAQPIAPSTTAAVVGEKTSSLRRSAVKGTIARGLGSFLQNVTVEDWPVMRGGKFHGFRLRSINPAWGVDLRPGDVVTRVNGMPIEHPEEADAALRSLEKASALNVDYERDGKPQKLALPITED